MRDINFFEPYLTKGRPQGGSSGSIRPLVVALLLLLAAWPLATLGYSVWLDNQNETIKTKVMDDPNYQLLAEADSERQYVDEHQAQLADIQNVDSKLKGTEWLNEAFLYSVMSTVPKDVQITQLEIGEKRITIAGTASGKPGIAELESNLRKADRFDALLVTSISNQEGMYSFEMTFELKDGENS